MQLLFEQFPLDLEREMPSLIKCDRFESGKGWHHDLASVFLEEASTVPLGLSDGQR